MYSTSQILLVVVAFLVTACGEPGTTENKGNSSSGPTSSSDQTSASENNKDANSGEPVELSSVTIGEQVWTKQNLNVSTFRNGDQIPYIEGEEAWYKASREKTPAWSYFNNDPEMESSLGKLYNHYAITDPRGIAPMGWHVPTMQEYETLLAELDGAKVAATPLKDLALWGEPDSGTPSGFDAPPSKGRFDDGTFIDFMEIGYWWSSTTYGRKTGYYLAMGVNDPIATISNLDQGYGFSVRLVKD